MGAPALQQPGRYRVQASAARRGQQRQWCRSLSQHQSQPEQDWRRPACQLTGVLACLGAAVLQLNVHNTQLIIPGSLQRQETLHAAEGQMMA